MYPLDITKRVTLEFRSKMQPKLSRSFRISEDELAGRNLLTHMRVAVQVHGEAGLRTHTQQYIGNVAERAWHLEGKNRVRSILFRCSGLLAGAQLMPTRAAIAPGTGIQINFSVVDERLFPDPTEVGYTLTYDFAFRFIEDLKGLR